MLNRNSFSLTKPLLVTAEVLYFWATNSNHDIMKPHHFFIPVLIALLTGCIAGQADHLAVPEPLGVHQTLFKKAVSVCADPQADSLRVEISSIVIDRLPDGLNADSLQQFIRKHSLTTLSSPEPAVDAEALFNHFSDEFGRVAGQFGGPCHGWSLNRKIECLMNAGGLFTVSALDFSYTGGAHPNTVITLQSYDLTTGQPLDVSSIIDDDKADSFKLVVEKTFRQVHDIADTTSWPLAGFWFEQGFTLPKNMAITPHGLYLLYNAYEVAPYSTGASELMLPAADFEVFVTREWRSRLQQIRQGE